MATAVVRFARERRRQLNDHVQTAEESGLIRIAKDEGLMGGGHPGRPLKRCEPPPHCSISPTPKPSSLTNKPQYHLTKKQRKLESEDLYNDPICNPEFSKESHLPKTDLINDLYPITKELMLAKGLNYAISPKSIPKEESGVFYTYSDEYHCRPNPFPNILKSDPVSIIHPADKENATVILDNTQYT
ncbi:hypothetical protein Trydic_g15029 [Trypoxylus dichotomus]